MRFIFKISQLPERYIKSKRRSWTKTGRTPNVVYLDKIRSDLLSHITLINCLQSQYTVRVTGSVKQINYKNFIDSFMIRENDPKGLDNSLLIEILSKEFGKRYKENGPSFLPNIKRKESQTKTNLFKGLKKIEKLLINLPFEISYSFLWLFSTRRIHFLDFSLDHYWETINWMSNTIKMYESMPEIPTLKALENAMRRITYGYRK